MNTLTDLKSPNELKSFFDANRALLADPKWLATAIQPQCRYAKQGGGLLHSQQNPNELANWLITIAGIKPRSYLEIGVFKCGTFFITDSYLRAAVPEYTRGTAVDKGPKPDLFDGYSAQNNVEFLRIWSKNINLTEPVDVSLIDGGHGVGSVHRDFSRVKDWSRLVGFHDITFCKSRTGVAWNQIVAAHPKCRSLEIVDDSNKRRAWSFGFGVLFLKP